MTILDEIVGGGDYVDTAEPLLEASIASRP
jgi:hypothetical protein